MKISIKGFIVPKKNELFYDCADRYAFDLKRNKFAISDGVSKSFFPKVWADVLVTNWVKNHWESSNEFIKSSQTKWLDNVTEFVNSPNVKWFTKNAFYRKDPGLATFVGLQFIEKNNQWQWKSYALGDSFLFFIPSESDGLTDKKSIKLSSKSDPILFDNFPDYLSSIGNSHKGENKSKSDSLSEGAFYLMTDALAEWFISENRSALREIDSWKNQKDFETFIANERSENKLGDDDSAILVIKIKNDGEDLLNYECNEVSEINSLIEKEQKRIELERKEKEVESKKSVEETTNEKELQPQKKEVLKEEVLFVKDDDQELQNNDEQYKKIESLGIEESYNSNEQNKDNEDLGEPSIESKVNEMSAIGPKHEGDNSQLKKGLEEKFIDGISRFPILNILTNSNSEVNKSQEKPEEQKKSNSLKNKDSEGVEGPQVIVKKTTNKNSEVETEKENKLLESNKSSSSKKITDKF